MTNPVTTENVWKALNKELFGILGMVTQENESRTVGIVYIVQGKKLYISTGTKSWKARHIQRNTNVSMTVPIAKRIPFLPWIKIPQATITFSGKARVFPAREADYDLLKALFRHFADDKELIESSSIIEIIPKGDFLTYGVGLPLIKMMKPELARGRAPVN
jgi:hypothetical protein